MDWRRAKTILILAFLLLDSFLGYQLWSGKGQHVQMGQQLVGASSSLQDILKARNINLEVEVPEEMPEMYYLNVKYEDFNLDKISRLPNQTTSLDGQVLESRFIRSLSPPRVVGKPEVSKTFSEHILFFSEYQPDLSLSREDKLVFLQYWDSYPFFGATLEINIAGQKVISYRQAHFQVVNKGSGKKVISSLTALRTLVENGIIENGQSIHSVELGYYGHTYDAEIQVVAPVWRVVHGDNQIHYVNGITGVVEKNPSLPKKE